MAMMPNQEAEQQISEESSVIEGYDENKAPQTEFQNMVIDKIKEEKAKLMPAMTINS